MTVEGLIELLRAMPQDAEVLTHANNHTTSSYDAGLRVAEAVFDYTGRRVVLVGNFSPDRFTGTGSHPRIVGEVGEAKP